MRAQALLGSRAACLVGSTRQRGSTSFAVCHCMSLARCSSIRLQAKAFRNILRHRALAATSARQQISCSSAAAVASMELHSSIGHDDLLRALQAVVPTLDYESYKGQLGKVGVMGGCREYTGAPFFAAMSAMRMGCDLAYVFCTPAAAPVIKGYSPELIVIPSLLDTIEIAKESSVVSAWQAYSHDLKSWLSKLSVLIIGPGLGDDQYVGECMYKAVKAARELHLPLVIDGSGLNFLAQRPELIRGYSNCILTPNIAEFGRLAAAVGVQLHGKIGVQWQQHAQELAAALDGPILLSKGQHDVITDGKQLLLVTADGSPRRCGGQGDVLTGTTAAFISWARALKRKKPHQQHSDAAAHQEGPTQELPSLMLAAYGGCITMRSAAVLTYKQLGRSMVAGDMISHLGDAVLEHANLLSSKL